MSRSNRARIAQETVEIVQRGWYEVNGVDRVEIGKQVDACLSATALIHPGDRGGPSEWGFAKRQSTHLEVRRETTLAAARRLAVDRQLKGVLLLNFASAKNAGGGFLGGSQAQEESLARSSALYASLQTQPEYYEINRSCRTALYTDHMILSPDVPVFRDDEGQLLANPFVVGILTAPAVNAGAVNDNEPADVGRILPTMAGRIDKVLAVASERGYEHLILGAWGCGVFRNNPGAIADLFSRALLGEGKWAQAFQSVTFAIFDATPQEAIYRPFQQRLTGVER